MITMGIETSCDETAIGILDDGQVSANIVSSQIAHTKFGGVVPELAARNHIKVIVPLTEIALDVAGLELHDIDLFAVTHTPGLIGALLVGLSYCKSLSIATRTPFIGVNHLEGHVYALHIEEPGPEYPYLVLLVSGGHTEVILVRNEFDYTTMGRTLDDACGEAFDKVAKLMGLPYPGGPYIEREAQKGTLGKVKFTVPRPGALNFSYAGLKTAVLYYTQENKDYNRSDVAAGFQDTAVEHLADVVRRAIKATGVRHLGIVGGVSVNRALRVKFDKLAGEMNVQLHIPESQYCTDNGAMIALAGGRRFSRFGGSNLDVDALARQTLDVLSIKENTRQ